jgi:PAS domain S-box-containing protein
MRILLSTLAAIDSAVWLVVVSPLSIASLIKLLASGLFVSLLLHLASDKDVDGSLTQNARLFSAFMDHLPALAWIKDIEGRYIYVNKLALSRLSTSKSDWCGKTDADLWPGDIAATCRDNDLKVIASRETLKTIETYLLDGQQHCIMVTKFPILDDTGEVILVGGTGVDITAQQRVEDALQEAENKYRDIFENAVEGIFQTTPDGQFITANPALARMLGYDSTEELLSDRTDISRQHYVDPAVRLRFKQALEEGGVIGDFEHRAYRKDGRKIWLSENVRSVCDANGAVLYYEGFTKDITERKRAEKEKERLLDKEREARLQAVVMSDANLALTHDLSLEQVLETLLEYLRKLVPYDSAIVMLVQDDSKFVVSAIKGYENYLSDVSVAKANNFDANSNLLFAEICCTSRSLLVADTKKNPHWQSVPGSEHIRNWLGVPLIAHDKIIGLYSLDKTEPGYFTQEHVKLAESLAAPAASAIENARLFQQGRLFRNLIDRSNDAIEVLDPITLRFLDSNTTAYQTLGYTREEFLSLTAFDIDPFIDQSMIARLAKEMEKSDFVIFESIHRRKDGSTFPVEINAKAIRLERDYRLAVVRDITERKRAETRSAGFANLAQKLSGAMTPLDAGRIIAETAQDLFGWDSCTLDLYDSEHDAIHPMLNVDTIGGKQVNVTTFSSGHKPTPRSKRAIDYGPELILRDEPLCFDKDAVPFGDVSRPSASIMTAPVRHASRVIGILSIQSYSRQVYDEMGLGDLQALADHCGEALNRMQAEERLRDSEERFRELFENAKDAIYVHDLNGIYTSVNRAAEQLSGYSREEIVGRHFSDFVASEYLSRVHNHLCKKLTDQGPTSYELEVIAKDGTRVPVELSSNLIYEDGIAVGVQGIARDITERKHAEGLLQTFPRRLIEAQEDERKRLARELHDEIGQILTAVTLNLHAVRSSGLAPGSTSKIDESILVVEDALRHTQNLAFELRPSALDDLGLAAAIRWFATRFAQRTGVKAEVDFDLKTSEGRRSKELETACFRIVQEALTNVARHAEAQTVSIRIRTVNEETSISIKDDGIGFDVSDGNGATVIRLGLRGMEERALALGGKLEIKSAPARGTEIRAFFPNEDRWNRR